MQKLERAAAIILVCTAIFLLLVSSRLPSPPAAIARADMADTLVNEGFEGSFPPAGWAATGHWGKGSCQFHGGSYSAWVEGAGGQSCEGFASLYHPNENSRLKYGPFSLSQATTAALTFDLWLWQAPVDTFSWGASIDGTHFYGITLTEAFSTTWETHGLNLADVPGLGDLRGEPNVWIAFDWHTDGAAEAFLGAFVDNVKVEMGVPASNTNTPTPTPTRTPTQEGSSGFLPLIFRLRFKPTPTLTPTATRTSDPNNHPPEFPSSFRFSSETSYTYDDLGRLTAATTAIVILTPATDRDGDPITYSWRASNGTIAGSGLEAAWHRSISYGRVVGGTVTVTASDGRGGTATKQIIFP